MAKPRSNRITEMGELQLDVFDALCEVGEGTVYDVLAQFPKRHQPRYTTALTVLRTLEEKGLVAHRTESRTYVFRPAVEPAAVRRRVLRDVLERVFAGSPRDLVAALLDDEAVTADVIAELKALIAATEGEDTEGEDDEQ